MPERQTVKTLRELGVKFLAEHFHAKFKRTTRRRDRRRASNLDIDKIRTSTAKCLRHLSETMQTEMFESIKSLLLQEKGLLDENYYKCLNVFVDERTRVLHLTSPRIFQDSSVALESFLPTLSQCRRLRELKISKSVLDLACFEMTPILRQLGRNLHSLEYLSVRGLQCADVDRETMEDFVSLLAENCKNLQHLDLSDSTLDNACCDALSKLSKLLTLKLDQTHLDTVGAGQILLRLSNLIQLDCGNRVQNWMSGLDHPVPLDLAKIQRITFRQPIGFGRLASVCETIQSVRIVYNEFESSDIQLDDNLLELMEFESAREERLEVELDLNGMNMLLIIQMDNLAHYGQFLRELTLTQCEFLHPQTLNPFAKHCPNLATLSIYGCGTLPDEMFEGEVPQLCPEPFPNLVELTYEGQLPQNLAGFLLSRSEKLRTLRLRTGNAFATGILRQFRERNCRRNLDRFYLTVSRTSRSFWPNLRDLLEDCPVLSRFELLCCDGYLRPELEEFRGIVKRRNWNLEFLYFIKPKPRQR